jgi:hypothetical protein
MLTHTPAPGLLARLFPRFDWRAGVVLAVVAAGAATMSGVARFGQAASFHLFADTRGWLGVPNFLDVVTNVPFAVAGVLGLVHLGRRVCRERAGALGGGTPLLRVDRVCLGAVFLGLTCTSIGSAYYHLAPGNERLFWDRLPMILTFVSVLATLIAERVSPKTAAWLLGPMLLAAGASLVYWRQTEAIGQGDLRAYFLVEGVTLASAVLVVALYRARYLPTGWLVLALACHGAAIVFEQLDRAVWSMWGPLGVEVVSGHTIKHLCAGAGAMVLVLAIRQGRAA